MRRFMTLAEIMTRYREQNSLSLRQMEEVVGLSFSYLSKIERGEIQPSKDTLKSISNKLNIPYYRLVIAAGHTFDLETDLGEESVYENSKEKNESYRLLGDAYQIYTLPIVRDIVTKNNISLSVLSSITEIPVSNVEKIINMDLPIGLEVAAKVNIFYNIQFYKVFQILKIEEDQDENRELEIALSVHNHIESQKLALLKKQYKETLSTNNSIVFNTKKEKDNVGKNDIIRIPIYGTIKAGYGMVAEQNLIGYDYVLKKSVSDGEYFYLIVRGDSMIEEGIVDGCKVLVRSQNYVEDGKIGVVIVDGEEATLKRVFYDGDNIILQASNKNIPPKVLPINEVMIQGQVKSYVVDVD